MSWSRIIRLLLAASLLAVLAGCSAVKLAYNNMPDLAYWWVDGYADLNEPQSLLLRNELGRLHDWHRTNELPRIAELLRQIRQMAPADTSAEQICRLYGDIRARFDAVTAQALAQPETLALASRLTPAQFKHLEARFAKGNLEWRRERGSADRAVRVAQREETERDRAEQFYGTLDDTQRKLLLDAVTRSTTDPQRFYGERVRRQQDMLETLRKIAGQGAPALDTAQASAALRAYVERTSRSPDPLYRAQADSALQENCETYARLHNSTTAEQRARAVARLAAYERDARELSTQR
jgi:hypothetical protein